MTRCSRFTPLLLLALVAVSVPVAARTQSLQAENDEVATCPEEGAAVDAAGGGVGKPTAKRNPAATPAKQKPAAPYRGSDNPARAPRWHRFLPGMFR